MRIKFGKEEYEVMKKFEAHHHPDIWTWIMDKVGKSDGLEILDVSEEACVFALTLAENHPTNKLTLACRGDKPEFDLPSNASFKKITFRNGYGEIANIGTKFDLIILNEVTHEISDLGAFFNVLKGLLNNNSVIVVMSRPKNPPIPVPECCLMLWRKLAPTREEIMAAANNAQLNTTSFSAAVPVSVDRFAWEKILYSGCFPAVRNTLKCDEKAIREFCNSKTGKIEFEEKISIFILRNN